MPVSLELTDRELSVWAKTGPRLLGAHSCYAADRDLVAEIVRTRVAPMASQRARCDWVDISDVLMFKSWVPCNYFKNALAVADRRNGPELKASSLDNVYNTPPLSANLLLFDPKQHAIVTSMVRLFPSKIMTFA
jgi:hypothetical protein